MATIKELLGEAYKEGMTFDEIESALSGRKLADLSSGEYVSKGKLTDYENRLRKAEEELRKRMTDDEKKAQEIADRENHYKAIERENSLYKYKADLANTIKDSAVLDNVATLYADGNFGEAIKTQNEYFARERENYEKQIHEALLRKNPNPAPQNNDGSQKNPNDLSMADWNRLKENNPQEYKRLMDTIK